MGYKLKKKYYFNFKLFFGVKCDKLGFFLQEKNSLY